MDEADRAQVVEERFLQAALASRRSFPQPVLGAGHDCHACGFTIAPERRAAVPGCCLCFDCQSDAERGMGR